MSISTKPQTSFVMPDGDVTITPRWIKEMAYGSAFNIVFTDGYDDKTTTEITIPEIYEDNINDESIRFTSIPKGCFGTWLYNLKTVNIPSTVKSIDPAAFQSNIYNHAITVNLNHHTNAIPGAPWGIPVPTINWLKGPATT